MGKSKPPQQTRAKPERTRTSPTTNGRRAKSPTFRPPQPEGLNPLLERNIEALYRRRRRDEEQAPLQDRVANAITRFTGSMAFVYVHLALVGFWVIANLGWIPAIRAWDESFVILAMLASVEAIFLSTFVLISQNRMQTDADKRADLDLQISLLTEHEITKLATLVADIADKIGVTPSAEEELQELERDVAPDAVLDKIEKEQGE